MVLDNGRVLGKNEKVKKAKYNTVNEIIEPVVAHKRSQIADNYNDLQFHLIQDFLYNSELMMMVSHTGF